ncbi:MAG: chemotaxis protein CheW [Bacillaceae bacterium]|nr:chemotaxis protein CheW [Bacillaceae bacterium]
MQHAEFIQEFVEEAEAHIETLEEGLLRYEKKDIDAELIHDLFRAVHSIKGTAGFFELKNIVELSHKMESIFGQIRDGKRSLSKSLIDQLLQATDQLGEMIRDPQSSDQLDIHTLIDLLDQIQQNTEPHAEITVSQQAVEADEPFISENKEQNEKEHEIEELYEELVPESEEIKEDDPPGKSLILEDRVRVHVSVLNDLLNLSSEMVLARNQLLSVLKSHEKSIPNLKNILQNINNLTTDLQEKVMQTRMQPIEKLFHKFPRMIRDLAKQVGKEVDLELNGRDVELDKSIIELLNDPLTHLLRNAVDHGIESPVTRENLGKNRIGSIHMNAYHEGGLVHIKIEDDGAGIDIDQIEQKAIENGIITREDTRKMKERDILQLIFSPGFSTASTVTDLSGRGVGLDVVKTNLEKLGGSIDIQTKWGEGTTFHLTMPLTVAIIPALIVSSMGEKFVIPQINVQEMVRVKPGEHSVKLERVRESLLLKLRNKLYPTVHLSEVLGMTDQSIDFDSGTSCVLILKSGSMRYGLIIDQVYDEEEILIKSLPQPLNKCVAYSGVTILGDGRVAFILDTDGLVEKAEISFDDEIVEPAEEETGLSSQKQELLMFGTSAGETFCMDLELIARIEKVNRSQIERIGDKDFIQFQGEPLRVIELEDYLPIGRASGAEQECYVIVPKLVKHPIGIMCSRIYDSIESSIEFSQNNDIAFKGIVGSAILQNRIVLLLNIYELFEMADPENYSYDDKTHLAQHTVLLAEDTPFFRRLEQQYMESAGYHVLAATNGKEAWEILRSHEVDVVVTDIHMPIMNGIEFVKKIRSDGKYADLPVIAVTSINEQAMKEKAYEAGVDFYEIKLDKQRLLEKLKTALQEGRSVV